MAAGKMRLLDLFCGEGGAGMGYHLSGFEIVGIDNQPMPRYPFTFVQGDALEYCAAHGHEFDAIHASPPCQAYSRSRSIRRGREHPQLLEQTRMALTGSGKIWVMENVVGAPMKNFSVILCGTSFGLRVYRHRSFESNLMFLVPECSHPSYLMDGYLCVFGDVVRGRQKGNRGNHYKRYKTDDGRKAMGIDWMSGRGLSQAVPPAYTEYIGRFLLEHLCRAQ